jgi:hypothetical protein
MASGVANGTIDPSVFVKYDSSAKAGFFLQAGAGDVPYGISQQATRRVPALGLDDGHAALITESLRVYEDDDECYLQIAGTVTLGQYLKPTTGGKGIAVTTNNDVYGAIALQPGTSGKVIKVKVQKGSYYGA